jgi:Uma2 family endonuclease
MSALTKKKLTASEYLALEKVAEFKSEFCDGIMYPLHWDGVSAMAGANPLHNRIKENLVGELFGRFGDGPCQSYSSDQRVLLSDTGMFAYPDIVVVCDTPQFSDVDPNALENPLIIFEVMSPSTEGYDRGFKFAQYRQQRSLREVIFVAQDQRRIERFVRQADETWTLTTFSNPQGELELGTISIRIPLARIYRGVALADEV